MQNEQNRCSAELAYQLAAFDGPDFEQMPILVR
jgi:hypothetical protein